MQEFFRDRSSVVYYDPETDALFLRYTGRVRGDEQFIEINTAVIAAFRQLNTSKFVADIREMGVISLNSQRWVIENLLPALINHLKGRKLHHAQLLDPQEVFSKVSASNIRNNSAQVQEGFEVRQFTSESELVSYLKELA